MNKSIIIVAIAISTSSILAQSSLTIKTNPNIQQQYEIMSNPVIQEEGISFSKNEINITGKAPKTDTIQLTLPTTTIEAKPMISDEEIAKMNADAAKYHEKRLARTPRTPTTLFDSCLVSANKYFPNDHAAAMKCAEETYKIILIHSKTKKLAAYYKAENKQIKTAYKQAGRIQPSDKRTFN